MSQHYDLLKHALRDAKTGWYRYLGVIWAIFLLLFIDLLTGRQFLQDKQDITVLTFKVPRIAFSLTYGVLFGIFVIWAISSARTVREIVHQYSEVSAEAAITNTPEYRLWMLSPVRRSRPKRIVFWLLAAPGLILLATVTVIHLLGINMPTRCEMTPTVYRSIGVINGLIFAFSIFGSLRWIYPNWEWIGESLAGEQAGRE